jgi:hypothetical protein
MGTRGLIGTLHKGDLHGSYSQYDMYPTGTGVALQNELRDFTAKHELTVDHLWSALRVPLAEMRYVRDSDEPTADELADLKDTHDASVSTGADWYSALRKNQGSLLRQLTTGIATDQPDFLQDSLFCEWAYIFDFDEKRVLILKGFNQKPEKQWERARVDVQAWKPRFEGDKLEYYGCTLAWTGTMPEFLTLDMEELEEQLSEAA